MRNMFSAYPEIILVDAIYILNDLQLPLYVMMAIDGNEESEIVGLLSVSSSNNVSIYFLADFSGINMPPKML